jgi:hypothetical protein
MGDTISPLSASVLRNLADKLYEKRKIAALEVLLLFNKTPTLSLSPHLSVSLSPIASFHSHVQARMLGSEKRFMPTGTCG